MVSENVSLNQAHAIGTREQRFLGQDGWASSAARDALPVAAIVFTLILDVLLSLISIGSSSAFNAFPGIRTQGCMVSFIIAAVVSLEYHLFGRAKTSGIPPGLFSLGKARIPVTIVALAWSIVGFVFYFWPLYVEPSLEHFSWSVLVFGVVVVEALLYWFFEGRKEARHVGVI